MPARLPAHTTLLFVLLSLAAAVGCAPTASEPAPPEADDPTDLPPTSTEPPIEAPTEVPTATPAPTETPSPSPFPVSTALIATPGATPVPGTTRIDEHGIEQVWVPAGKFLMGTADIEGIEGPSWARERLPSEQPQYEVTLTHGYWIDKYEVTNAAFDAFVEAGGYTIPAFWSEAGWEWLQRQDIDRLPDSCVSPRSPSKPQVCITWYEAEAYARWRGGRLPTEAEWEYAARGPESLIYPYGNTFDPDRANVVGSTGLTKVGSYPDGVSWVGAHDMSGNAMEWVQNWLDDDYYELGINIDPQGPDSGRIKIEKGGWWGSNPLVARAAYHHFEDPPHYSDHHIGVRIVTPVITEGE